MHWERSGGSLYAYSALGLQTDPGIWNITEAYRPTYSYSLIDCK